MRRHGSDPIGWFKQCYNRLVAEALEHHDCPKALRPAGIQIGKGARSGARDHNLMSRSRHFDTENLRFLHDTWVPFMNDQAERGLRLVKLCMKISGAFRSRREAQDFATLRNVRSTAWKRGDNRIETLLQWHLDSCDVYCTVINAAT